MVQNNTLTTVAAFSSLKGKPLVWVDETYIFVGNLRHVIKFTNLSSQVDRKRLQKL